MSCCRLIEAPGRPQRIAEIGMRRRVVRFQGDAALQAPDAGCDPPFGSQCNAKVDPGGRKIRADRQDALIAVDGVSQFALAMP